MKYFAKIVNGSQNTSSQKLDKVLSAAVLQLAQNQEFRYTLYTYDTSINTWLINTSIYIREAPHFFSKSGHFFQFSRKRDLAPFPHAGWPLVLNFLHFFVLHSFIATPCLLVYVNAPGYFLESTKLCFFLSCWKYFVYFLC